MSIDTGYQDLTYVQESSLRPPVQPRERASSRCQSDVATASDNSTIPACVAVTMDHIFRRNRQQLPDKLTVIRLSHAVSRAVFEIIAGYRSVAQLNFHLSPDCISKLQNQAMIETEGYTHDPEPGTAHGQVQSMRMSCTSSGAWECTVILGFKYRVRAVALRIELWHGRWQVTSLEML